MMGEVSPETSPKNTMIQDMINSETIWIQLNRQTQTYSKLYDYFTVKNLLDNKQYGFRSLHSTALALGNLTNTWLLNIDNGKMNSVVFLDIKKAFDTVDHKILIDKLYFYGIVEQELDFFRSYLTDRVQCCSVNGVSSGFRSITCGVPQGSILGPLLFIVYMNDLPSAAKDVNITMFADDTSLNQEIKTASDIEDNLIPAFAKVYDWLRHNNLSLNAIKTEFMIIGSHHRVGRLDNTPESTPYIVQVGDMMIKRVTKAKYLGLVVDENLSWDEHVEYRAKKSRNIGIIKRTRSILPHELLTTLYMTLVEPHFRYCDIVWGQCNETLKDKLQTLQNRAARVICNRRFEDVGDHQELLNHLGWLNVRQLFSLDHGVFVFKAINGLIPDQFNEMYSKSNTMHSHGTRAATTDCLFIERINLTAGQKSISVSVSKLWNEIPFDIRNSQSLNVFKKKYKEFLMDQGQ